MRLPVVAGRRFSSSEGNEGGFTGGGSFPEPYLYKAIPPVPDPVFLSLPQLLARLLRG